jgi:UDP-N-acetyl-D-mannosaminuronic acid dehydrogenase
VLAVEPNIETMPKALEGVQLVSLEEALVEADLIVVLVAHSPFVTARDKLRALGNVLDVTGVLHG